VRYISVAQAQVQGTQSCLVSAFGYSIFKVQKSSYYINFQLPFHRTAIGLDTLDLELDIVVEPDHEWHWKDVENYHKGIDSGVIRGEWVEAIDAAKQEVFETLDHRLYPFDGSWLDWKPDPAWQPPGAMENWDKI
jgi:protein associated with RNAse G/E